MQKKHPVFYIEFFTTFAALILKPKYFVIMAIIKPFKGLRPPKEIVKDLASRPYDVLNSEEARKEAAEINTLYSMLLKLKLISLWEQMNTPKKYMIKW